MWQQRNEDYCQLEFLSSGSGKEVKNELLNVNVTVKAINVIVSPIIVYGLFFDHAHIAGIHDNWIGAFLAGTRNTVCFVLQCRCAVAVHILKQGCEDFAKGFDNYTSHGK